MYRFKISPIDKIVNWYHDQLILTSMSTVDIYISNWYFYQLLSKKSRNGDTLSPVELIVWLEQGNQGDWREQDG